MTSRTVKVACTQAEPAWLDVQASVAKTCALVTEAASNGAQLVAFPECWIPGYQCWIWTRLVGFGLNVRYIQSSLRLDSPELAAIRACAGSSAIFGPDGRRLTEPVDDKTETILYADLEMDAIHRTEMFADFTGHYSRPDLLRLAVDREVKAVVTSTGAVGKESKQQEETTAVLQEW